jgi:hypothetical protein
MATETGCGKKFYLLRDYQLPVLLPMFIEGPFASSLPVMGKGFVVTAGTIR